MNTSSHRIIATRRLTYRTKGEETFKDFTVRISEPYSLTEDASGVSYAQDAAGCVVSFDGLPERDNEVVGADTLQAIELAVQSAERALRRLSKHYDIYMDGEPYFED
jgi:hypothetical protein